MASYIGGEQGKAEDFIKDSLASWTWYIIMKSFMMACYHVSQELWHIIYSGNSALMASYIGGERGKS